MGQNINNRQRMLVALAVLGSGEKASDLLSFLSPKDLEACTSALKSCLEIDPDEREFRIKGQIGSLIASEQWSGLAEIHPAWLLEALKEESPRVIGIILRYLPSRHVRYILENLPPQVRCTIPNVVEAFSVPQAVLDVIRRSFESKFASFHISRSLEKFGFEHLYYLRGEELEVFFKDLGLQELAMALHGISGKSLGFLFNRLSLRDAKRLQSRMKELGDISEPLKRQARFTVLEVEGEHLGPELLLMEIGLASFARALSSDHADLARMLEIKLDPTISYVLKRYIDERLNKNTHSTAAERQSLILSRVARLARENLIDESWTRFFPTQA